MGFDSSLLDALHQVPVLQQKIPTSTYVSDAEAMAAIPADVIERLDSYVFQIYMPGWRSGDIRVQVEDDNVLVISGDRKPEEEKVGFKYLRKERRIGRFMRKFVLPVCQNGVQKLEPPQPKKPRTIEVNIG